MPISRDELVKMAEKHGATSYRNRADTQNPAFGFTAPQLESFASAILERAAVECEQSTETVSMHATSRDCSNFNDGLKRGASAIRALKPQADAF